MPYAHIQFSQAKTQLAARLGGPSKKYWVDAELGMLIVEAMRTWNTVAPYWKARGQFVTAAAMPFYDLPTQLPNLLGYTVKDQDLVGLMQYQMQEPYSPAVWTGTGMFALSDFTLALQRRRNQFLLETGMIVTRSTPNIQPPPVSRIPLADNVIEPRWLWFKDTSNPAVYSPLWRSDEFQLNAFSHGWAQNASKPTGYSVSVTPPLSVQLAPAPNVSGSLEMLSVDAPADLDPTNGVLMNIPDDFTWAVRFGAMADLLSQDGNARDPLRAAYCESRYQQGVALARMGSSVLQAQIDDVPVPVVSLQEFDTYRRNWRNSSGAPSRVAMAGFNMAVLADVPDAGPYGVTMDVVQNAVVPVVDADEIQLGREELDAILGYAQHLGSFKQCGAEFQATQPLLENFYRLGSMYNEKIRANAVFWDVLKDRAIRPQVTKTYRDTRPETATPTG